MKAIKSYFKVLLAEKELRERRTISLRKVVIETSVPNSTVLGLANNTIKRVPLDELAILCEYLQCGVADLLRLEEINGGRSTP